MVSLAECMVEDEWFRFSELLHPREERSVWLNDYGGKSIMVGVIFNKAKENMLDSES
jgi:hypothetical protein